LSAQAARMIVLAALGCGASRADLAAALDG
jgi:hypothetical protein